MSWSACAALRSLRGHQASRTVYRVAVELVLHADEGGVCWPSVRTLAAAVCCTRRNVQLALRQLEREGLGRLRLTPSRHHREPTRWRLRLAPEEAAESVPKVCQVAQVGGVASDAGGRHQRRMDNDLPSVTSDAGGRHQRRGGGVVGDRGGASPATPQGLMEGLNEELNQQPPGKRPPGRARERASEPSLVVVDGGGTLSADTAATPSPDPAPSPPPEDGRGEAPAAAHGVSGPSGNPTVDLVLSALLGASQLRQLANPRGVAETVAALELTCGLTPAQLVQAVADFGSVLDDEMLAHGHLDAASIPRRLRAWCQRSRERGRRRARGSRRKVWVQGQNDPGRAERVERMRRGEPVRDAREISDEELQQLREAFG